MKTKAMRLVVVLGLVTLAAAVSVSGDLDVQGTLSAAKADFQSADWVRPAPASSQQECYDGQIRSVSDEFQACLSNQWVSLSSGSVNEEAVMSKYRILQSFSYESFDEFTSSGFPFIVGYGAVTSYFDSAYPFNPTALALLYSKSSRIELYQPLSLGMDLSGNKSWAYEARFKYGVSGVGGQAFVGINNSKTIAAQTLFFGIEKQNGGSNIYMRPGSTFVGSNTSGMFVYKMWAQKNEPDKIYMQVQRESDAPILRTLCPSGCNQTIPASAYTDPLYFFIANSGTLSSQKADLYIYYLSYFVER